MKTLSIPSRTSLLAPPKGAKEAISIFFIQALGAGLLLAMHLVLTRTMTPTEYGMFNYGLTTANTLVIFTCLGFQISLIRFVSEYSSTNRIDLMKGILSYSARLFLLTSTLFSILLLASHFSTIGSPELRSALLYSSIILPFVGIGIWLGVVTRGLKRLITAVAPNEVIIPLLVIILVILLTEYCIDISPEKATLIYMMSASAALLFGLFFLFKAIPKSLFSTKKYSDKRLWLKTSTTMLAGAVCQEIINRADVLLIGFMVNIEQSGLYSIALRLSALNVFSLKIVDTLVAPKIASAYYSGDKQSLRKVIIWGTKISALGALPPSLLLLAFPEEILGFFGQKYTAASPILRILVIGQCINGLTGPVGHSLLMTGNEKKYSSTIFGITILNISGQILFIHYYGSYGAAIVTSTTAIFFNLILLFMSINFISKTNHE
jgi:O-antigen/teichoic acid export membrane protein